MNKKQRLMTVLRQQEPDRIPWVIYPLLVILGASEREFRNRGLSFYLPRPLHRLRRSNVEIIDTVKIDEENEIKTITRRYATPKGDLVGVYRMPYEAAPQTFEEAGLWHPSPIPSEGIWTLEYPFKKRSDYRVLEFIMQDSTYQEDYDRFREASKFLGEEGIVMAGTGKSPFQSIIYDWMGHVRCFTEWNDHPQEFNRLYEIMFERQREVYQIASNSPAEIVWEGENVTGVLTSPWFFERFCVPFYNEMAEVVHQKGKIYGAHLDGQLRCLKELIAKTKLDFIDAFTPPPLGDLPMEEARASWPDKVLICNFPENVYFWTRERIREYTLGLLGKIAPGRNFILTTSENYPEERWVETFEVISNVLEQYGEYPLSF